MGVVPNKFLNRIYMRMSWGQMSVSISHHSECRSTRKKNDRNPEKWVLTAAVLFYASICSFVRNISQITNYSLLTTWSLITHLLIVKYDYDVCWALLLLLSWLILYSNLTTKFSLRKLNIQKKTETHRLIVTKTKRIWTGALYFWVDWNICMFSH